MNLALFDFDGTITTDDREMLDLAHRKFYRWREIRDLSEAVALGGDHPESAR